LKPSILIVDDEAGVRSALSGVLRDEGYGVEAVESGEACLDRVIRAQYDVIYSRHRQERWRLVTTGATAENDFETEQILRLTVLEVLYARRRTEPENPALSPLDLESLTGTPREHLEFTIWYLIQKKFVTRDDQSRLTITVDGVDFVEKNHGDDMKRRLTAVNQP